MTTRTAWWFVAAASFTALVVVFFGAPNRGEPERRRAERLEPASLPTAHEAAVAPRASGTTVARAANVEHRATPPKQDEASLMAKLRGGWTTDPATSIELAREGNRRFPASDDAPERSYLLVRSLVNLGRFEEAKAEARVMVDTYRDTDFANEVERHLLSNPLTHPSERGFGMDRE